MKMKEIIGGLRNLLTKRPHTLDDSEKEIITLALEKLENIHHLETQLFLARKEIGELKSKDTGMKFKAQQAELAQLKIDLQEAWDDNITHKDANLQYRQRIMALEIGNAKLKAELALLKKRVDVGDIEKILNNPQYDMPADNPVNIDIQKSNKAKAYAIANKLSTEVKGG